MIRDRTFSTRTASPEQTEELGEAIGRRLPAGATVALTGPLGAGKTTMVRGLCRGLDVIEEAVSPTFLLCELLPGRVPVAHVDLYRLEHENEIDEIGVFDLAGSDHVVIAEWADRSPALMDLCEVQVLLTVGVADPQARGIRLQCSSAAALWFRGMQPWW